MRCNKLFEMIDFLAQDYIGVWQDVCNLESPTGYKEGVDAVGCYLADRAREKGWTVETLPQSVSGDCICITMNPKAKAAPIALSGHMDTVHAVGSFGSPAVRIENGSIIGPGVVDCKGGIVAAFLAMDALERSGFCHRPILLLLQSDEENSSKTSDKETVRFMAEKAKSAVAFLNAEGGSQRKLTVARKGIIRYRLDVQGRAAHSSKCQEGASAIAEAAHKIIELERWKEKDGITCNCGVIQGGTVANTVPEHCSVIVDIRYRTAEEYEQIKERVADIAATSHVAGTSCTVSVVSERVAMEKTEKNLALFDSVRRIFAENGLGEPCAVERSGGSDAADMTAAGIPTLDSIGVCGDDIHTLNERAPLTALAESAKKMASIVYCFEN